MTAPGVVIVNYRTAGLVIDCLRSLAPEVAAAPGTRLVIVDNASGDGSAEQLAAVIAGEGYGTWAELLPLDENRGFAAGNNAGLRRLRAGADAPGGYWFLNPDTLVRPGALAALVARLAAEPRAGIVGSRLEHADGTPQPSAFRFHDLANQLDGALSLGPVSRLLSRRALVLPVPAAATPVEWVSGASLFVRREVLDEVGDWDEGFFLYYEEVDLCLRAARAGWSCWYEPASRVVHLVGRSTGVDPARAVRRLPGYVLDSRRRYFVKNHGRAYAVLTDLLWVAGHLAWRLRMRLQGRPERAERGVLRDFLARGAMAPGPGPRRAP